MKGLLLALPAVGLSFALNASVAAGAGPEQVRIVDPPKGVCHAGGHGVSVVVEDTSEAACRERQAQCERDHPGSEKDCHSQWTENARRSKAKKVPASR